MIPNSFDEALSSARSKSSQTIGRDFYGIMIGAYAAILHNLVSDSGFLSPSVLIGGPFILITGVASIQLLRIAFHWAFSSDDGEMERDTNQKEVAVVNTSQSLRSNSQSREYVDITELEQN